MTDQIDLKGILKQPTTPLNGPISSNASNHSGKSSNKTKVETKPELLLKYWQIVLLSLTAASTSIGWSVGEALMLPALLSMGLSAQAANAIWVVNPVLGIFVQPIVAHASDHYHSSMGNRRPFILLFGLLSVAGMLVLAFLQYIKDYVPYTSTGNTIIFLTIYAAFGIADFSLDTIAIPARAYLSDRLPPEQVNLGNSIYGAGTSIGQCLGLAIILLPVENFWPFTYFNHFGSIWLVCSIVTVICNVVVVFVPTQLVEISPLDREDDEDVEALLLDGESYQKKIDLEQNTSVADVDHPGTWKQIEMYPAQYGSNMDGTLQSSNANDKKEFDDENWLSMSEIWENLKGTPGPVLEVFVSQLFWWYAVHVICTWWTSWVITDVLNLAMKHGSIGLMCTAVASLFSSVMIGYRINAKFGARHTYHGAAILWCLSLASLFFFRTTNMSYMMSGISGLFYPFINSNPYLILEQYGVDYEEESDDDEEEEEDDDEEDDDEEDDEIVAWEDKRGFYSTLLNSTMAISQIMHGAVSGFFITWIGTDGISKLWLYSCLVCICVQSAMWLRYLFMDDDDDEEHEDDDDDGKKLALGGEEDDDDDDDDDELGVGITNEESQHVAREQKLAKTLKHVEKLLTEKKRRGQGENIDVLLEKIKLTAKERSVKEKEYKRRKKLKVHGMNLIQVIGGDGGVNALSFRGNSTGPLTSHHDTSHHNENKNKQGHGPEANYDSDGQYLSNSGSASDNNDDILSHSDGDGDEGNKPTTGASSTISRTSTKKISKPLQNLPPPRLGDNSNHSQDDPADGDDGKYGFDSPNVALYSPNLNAYYNDLQNEAALNNDSDKHNDDDSVKHNDSDNAKHRTEDSDQVHNNNKNNLVNQDSEADDQHFESRSPKIEDNLETMSPTLLAVLDEKGHFSDSEFTYRKGMAGEVADPASFHPKNIQSAAARMSRMHLLEKEKLNKEQEELQHAERVEKRKQSKRMEMEARFRDRMINKQRKFKQKIDATRPIRGAVPLPPDQKTKVTEDQLLSQTKYLIKQRQLILREMAQDKKQRQERARDRKVNKLLKAQNQEVNEKSPLLRSASHKNVSRKGN